MPLTHLYRYPIIVPRYDGKTPVQRGPLQLYSSRYVLWVGFESCNWSPPPTVAAIDVEM